MTLPKISSIWRRTSTWLDRSSFGSRSWITRFWIRNLTSRNDSRTGACVWSRLVGCGVVAGGCAPPPAPPGAGTGTLPDPSAGWLPAPGRALSMRLSRLIAYTLSATAGRFVAAISSPGEQRLLLCRLLGRVTGLGRAIARDRRGEPQDVLGHLRLAVREEEGHAPIERVHHAPTVGDDGVVHPATDRVLDVRDADAEGRVGAVEHQPDLVRPVAQLLRHFQEEADV